MLLYSNISIHFFWELLKNISVFFLVDSLNAILFKLQQLLLLVLLILLIVIILPIILYFNSLENGIESVESEYFYIIF